MKKRKKMQLTALQWQQFRRNLLFQGAGWAEHIVTAIAPEDDLDPQMSFVAEWSFYAGARLMLETTLDKGRDHYAKLYSQLLEDATRDWDDGVDEYDVEEVPMRPVSPRERLMARLCRKPRPGVTGSAQGEQL